MCKLFSKATYHIRADQVERSRGYRGCRRSKKQRKSRRCRENSHAEDLNDGKGKLISQEEKEVQ